MEARNPEALYVNTVAPPQEQLDLHVRPLVHEFLQTQVDAPGVVIDRTLELPLHLDDLLGQLAGGLRPHEHAVHYEVEGLTVGHEVGQAVLVAAHGLAAFPSNLR
jgi:hypothetical protein